MIWHLLIQLVAWVGDKTFSHLHHYITDYHFTSSLVIVTKYHRVQSSWFNGFPWGVLYWYRFYRIDSYNNAASSPFIIWILLIRNCPMVWILRSRTGRNRGRPPTKDHQKSPSLWQREAGNTTRWRYRHINIPTGRLLPVKTDKKLGFIRWSFLLFRPADCSAFYRSPNSHSGSVVSASFWHG